MPQGVRLPRTSYKPILPELIFPNKEKGFNMESKYKVALMHVSPVFLDTKKTIDKVCSLIEEASSKGARLIVFPETFVSAFPIWSALRAPIYNHKWFNLLAAQTVHIDGPEVARVCEYA